MSEVYDYTEHSDLENKVFRSNGCDAVEQMIELFHAHRECFGLSETEYLNEQCEFEEAFAKLICVYRGHELIPDQCGIKGHEYCVTCGERREVLEGGVATNHDGTPIND